MIFCKKYNPRGLQNGFGDFCFTNINAHIEFLLTDAVRNAGRIRKIDSEEPTGNP